MGFIELTKFYFYFFKINQVEKFDGMMRSNEGVVDELKSKKRCSGKRKRKLSRVKKEPHHWLPRIHEDYYGPRMHRPKHH